jgi:hypothetical protein
MDVAQQSVICIGPKMYHGQATLQDNSHHGSTRLHMDLTDAVNIMLWAAKLLDGRAGFAVWDIFPPEATPILRRFFKEEAGFMEKGDCIHSQMMCVSPAMMERLSVLGVRVHRIHQYEGQAVYIPAGCPHQV